LYDLKIDVLKNQKKAYLYASLAIFCWSTVAIAFKIGLAHMHIIQLLAVSCYTAIAGLSVYLWIAGKWKEFYLFDKRFIVKSAFLGFLNPFTYYLVLFKAYSLLPAQIAQPLNYTWPLVLVILSVIFLKQKISTKAILGIILSFIGVMIISLQGKLSFMEIKNPTGVIFSTCSSLIWATYWIINTSRSKYEESGLLLNFIFAGIYITILMIVYDGFSMISMKGIASAIYVGCFEMGFTFILWLKALRLSHDSSKVSHLVYFAPFLSLLFIHLILKETIFFTTFIGLTFIIGGVILSKIIRKPKTN
jgi:drug/metabolite transporter (DMT)-like permease